MIGGWGEQNLEVLQGFSHPRSPKADNLVFALHYRVSFLLLAVCTIFISLYMHLHPDTIRCLKSHNAVDGDFMNHYCWMEGIYNVATCTKDGASAYPFVSPHLDGEEKFKNTIYQWIPLILFLHAVSFYIPHYIWKSIEDGHLAMLVGDLRGKLFAVEKERIDESKKRLVEYLSRNLGYYGPYFVGYCLCEGLNLIGILSQIFIANRVYRFNEYGVALLEYMTRPSVRTIDPLRNISEFSELGSTYLTRYDWMKNKTYYCYEDVNPIAKYFPTVTKCRLDKFGPGGNKEPVDGLCSLGVNLINQVLFTFLWFWFIFVAIITCLALLYRFLTIVSPTVRRALLRSRHAITDDEDLYGGFYKGDLGDWYILYQLSKNLSSSVRFDIFYDLAVRVQEIKSS